MTCTPARLHPFTGEGGLADDSTRRVFLKGASSIVRLTPVRRGTAAKGHNGTITLGTDPAPPRGRSAGRPNWALLPRSHPAEIRRPLYALHVTEEMTVPSDPSAYRGVAA